MPRNEKKMPLPSKVQYTRMLTHEYMQKEKVKHIESKNKTHKLQLNTFSTRCSIVGCKKRSCDCGKRNFIPPSPLSPPTPPTFLFSFFFLTAAAALALLSFIRCSRSMASSADTSTNSFSSSFWLSFFSPTTTAPSPPVDWKVLASPKTTCAVL